MCIQVYLFVSLRMIVGCLVVEPIEEAFKVVSCSVAGHSDKRRESQVQPLSSLGCVFVIGGICGFGYVGVKNRR